MRNPLVVLLGISEFKQINCDPLIGVKYDMIACRRLFEFGAFPVKKVFFFDHNI